MINTATMAPNRKAVATTIATTNRKLPKKAYLATVASHAEAPNALYMTQKFDPLQTPFGPLDSLPALPEP
jgi:hypothetical protein